MEFPDNNTGVPFHNMAPLSLASWITHQHAILKTRRYWGKIYLWLCRRAAEFLWSYCLLQGNTPHEPIGVMAPALRRNRVSLLRLFCGNYFFRFYYAHGSYSHRTASRRGGCFYNLFHFSSAEHFRY